MQVLIAEDDPIVALALAARVRELGHEPLGPYADGASALAAASAGDADLYLLDIGLPGLDGYEVARTLRDRPDAGDSVLVAMTGYCDESDRRRAREAGFDYHLIKPVDPDHLLGFLDRLPARRP